MLAHPQHAPFITLTGADEFTDLSDLVSLDAEIGLLYSATRARRADPIRYPRREWIEAAAAELPRAALHVCGNEALKHLREGRINVARFARIQINGNHAPDTIEAICADFPAHRIITQHHSGNAALLRVEAPNHVVLVDASGGKGLLPSGWWRPRTEKPVGFAGGLGPDNLARELPMIRHVALGGWWVDMENSLRTDDRFSIARARLCVEAFKHFMGSAALCPAIVALANDMQYKLNKNARKPCAHFQAGEGTERRWENCEISWLIKRLKEELQELQDELAKDDIAEARLECADIANFAMMIHDNLTRGKEHEKGP